MKSITSINNSYIKKLNAREDIFIIEGYNLVNEAKVASYLQEVLIVNIEDEVKGVDNILVTKEIIQKLSKTKTPQNIIGICKYPIYSEIKGTRFLILDNIQDPGNFGTLIRSALGFNIDMIITSNNTVDILNDKVIRATQGALFHIPVVKRDLKQIIKELKEKNILIISTILNGEELSKINISDNYAIILGNEGNGVSKELINISDVNITIPTTSKLESLNVSIAGAIIMHYLYYKSL